AASVTHACHDLPEAEPAGDRDRCRSIGPGAVAELAVAVVAPTVGMVIRGQSARVRVARVHLVEPDPAGDRNRQQALEARAVTNLAEIAVAPAVGPILRGHPAGVGRAC